MNAAPAHRPATIFETERLLAREWTSADVDDAFAMYGDPEVVRHLGTSPEPDRATMAERLEFLMERDAAWPWGYGNFATVRRDDGELVGASLLKELPTADGDLSGDIEIGWHLKRAAWGHGYATEMGRGLLALGFERLSLERIHVVVAPENEASLAVARRIGVVHTGRTTAYYEGRELEHFELTADEWHARPRR